MVITDFRRTKDMSKRRKPHSSQPIPDAADGPRMSPEVDLLEQLCGADRPLNQARLSFPSLDHARRVVGILLASGAARLISIEGGAETLVPEWEVRRIMEDPDEWSRSDETRPVLRLTEHGYDQFVRDSEGFFDELFGQR